ncbi:MAG: hypothetical protein NXI00_05345 [Cytophagales bacterium]|nr:hypothetical protein [Cytophagales bacterium]
MEEEINIVWLKVYEIRRALPSFFCGWGLAYTGNILNYDKGVCGEYLFGINSLMTFDLFK